MENGDTCVDKKATTLNSVLVELENAVGVAGRNADKYENKINKLDIVYLESSKEQELKATDKPDVNADVNADTLLYKLRALVKRLETSNQKNIEILDKLNELI
jgi:hypothetical protein